MAKSKIIKSSSCDNGNHQFIVSNWQYSATAQKANAWTCQWCLVSIDGKSDINKIKDSLHSEIE